MNSNSERAFREMLSPGDAQATAFPNHEPPPAGTIMFHRSPGDAGLLFTIKPDGAIVRGPAFTTEDEMSLHFWEMVEAAFPVFLKAASAKSK